MDQKIPKNEVQEEIERNTVIAPKEDHGNDKLENHNPSEIVTSTVTPHPITTKAPLITTRHHVTMKHPIGGVGLYSVETVKFLIITILYRIINI